MSEPCPTCGRSPNRVSRLYDYDGMIERAQGQVLRVVWSGPLTARDVSTAGSIAFRLRHSKGIAQAVSRRANGRIYVLARTER